VVAVEVLMLGIWLSGIGNPAIRKHAPRVRRISADEVHQKSAHNHKQQNSRKASQLSDWP
jgi:hypothetical protein